MTEYSRGHLLQQPREANAGDEILRNHSLGLSTPRVHQRFPLKLAANDQCTTSLRKGSLEGQQVKIPFSEQTFTNGKRANIQINKPSK